MLGRVTPGFVQNDFLYNIQNQNVEVQKYTEQLSSGKKINLPSDDPANAINYMEWESNSRDIQKFNQIINAQKDKLNTVDGYMGAMNDSLQRVRELLIQGAQGTNTQEGRTAIAMEVDQLLRQMVSTANSEYNGTAVFAGTSTVKQPYRMTENFSEDTNLPLISQVEYFGNGQQNVMDIGEDDRIASVLPGIAIFQATKTIIQGTVNVNGYVADQDSKILIDGTEIIINSGDNLETIAAKINNSDTTVKAKVETNAQGETRFQINSISARKPWLQDINGGTVLQNLGLIDNGIEGGRNFSPEARIEKRSIFDVMIDIRDDLLNDRVAQLGGEDLGLIDQSLSNIINYRTYNGAVVNRLEMTHARNANQDIYLQNSASNVIATDYTKAITDLKMAEFAQQTALNIGAKLMPPTLMDFLR